ncbi:Asp-tRNA(Asn)/Glu-tRNA(Gln) amidotransferase subunit GatB [Patescibacteria group bacterium]|nr:MAG: Asp-tRNA(Asn)/Glu-tRNA(Gln) amidotransferase subunit GatB [Patescibacteria group bacterium]
MSFRPVIGLEIHVQLKTKSKMFCGCNNESEGVKPNTNVCPVCLGLPGALPVANKEAIKSAVMAGLALDGTVAGFSKFDRKNYFYPDLPKGYQISQYDQPIAKGGFLEFIVPLEKEKKLGSKKVYQKRAKITRIHLEEDAGKSIHPQGRDYSLIDLNRCGTPLLEIVTEPDISSPLEAKFFLQELRKIMRYLGISDADMEKGHLRCDANVSLKGEGTKILGTKTEVKNMNSFRAVEKALTYEIKRQENLLKKGKKIVHETRGWDEDKGETIPQRSKEEAHDYRYFPEPDLPPLELSQAYITEIRNNLPETPEHRRNRFKKEFKLGLEQLAVLIEDKELGDYFGRVISELREWVKDLDLKQNQEKATTEMINLTANLFVTELVGMLRDKKVAVEKSKITPENLAELVTLIYKGEISQGAGKKVLGEMLDKGGDPSHIIDEQGLKQISDEKKLGKVIGEVIKENKGPVDDFKEGKQEALGFLVGQAMQKTKGQANPQVVNKLFRRILKK